MPIFAGMSAESPSSVDASPLPSSEEPLGVTGIEPTASDPRLLAPGPVLAAVVVSLVGMLWPLLAGFRAANDDINFVRAEWARLGTGAALADHWWTSASFRPLEVLVALWSDPTTLESWATIPVQGLGLLVFLLGVDRLARLCLPRSSSASLIAIAFLAISAPTTCSIWQMDTCSQTWSAALGAWATIAAWRAVERARAGCIDWTATITLAAIFAIGVNVKETFYGWSLGLGLALMGAAAIVGREGVGRAIRLVPPTLVVVLIPALHLFVRFQFGSLGARFDGTDESRYQAQFGMNLVLNALVSLGAGFGPGPSHLVADEEAPVALRLLPIASAAAAVFGAFVAVGLALLARRRPAGVRGAPFAFVAFAALLSLSATLPMETASELYVLGPNLATAILFGGSLVVLWRNAVPDERLIARGTAAICGFIVLASGAYGLWSRAEHFRIVWRSVDDVNRAALDFQSKVPPRLSGLDTYAGTLHLVGACQRSQNYSQYVISPAQAINVDRTREWMAARDPERAVWWVVDSFGARENERTGVFGCEEVPSHGHW